MSIGKKAVCKVLVNLIIGGTPDSTNSVLPRPQPNPALNSSSPTVNNQNGQNSDVPTSTNNVSPQPSENDSNSSATLQNQNENGVFQQLCIYYAMGLALICQGGFSICYHICPTNRSLQFDTTIMYIMCILGIVKIYQVGILTTRYFS